MSKLPKKNRVLLADAGFSAIPLLNALKDNGYHVGVCGSKIDDPCHQLADESHIIDYSNTLDLEKIYKSYSYNFLVAGCTDISYISCSIVAEKLKIPGFDLPSTTKKIFNKNEFRNLCHLLNIPSPKFVSDPSLVAALQFPILKKPVDSFSGKGIEKFNSKQTFFKPIKNNKSTREYSEFVYEEFVEGLLYSHSAFIKNGKISIDFFVSEYSTINPYQVNSSHIETSLSLSIKNRIRECIINIAKECKLNDGLIHTQFISNNSEFWLIEMTRRCPGDLYSLLIQYSTGANYPGLYTNSFLNKSGKIKFKSKKRYFSRHTLSLLTQEIFTGITCEIPSESTIIYNLKKLGEPIKASPLDRAAVIFVEHKSSKKMKAITPNLFKKITLNK